MRSFRSGTLGRSVRRWGPRVNFGKFQRKSHQWKYVTDDEAAIDRTGASPLSYALIDSGDWSPSAAGGSGCRNIVIDFSFGCTWSHNNTATAFESWGAKMGIFIKDRDDATSTLNAMFTSHRAIDWAHWCRNTASSSSATVIGGTERYFIRRKKFKVNFLKFDEEVAFYFQLESDVTTVINDMRGFIFGRVSWEAV